MVSQDESQMDPEAGATVWAPKYVRHYLFTILFKVCTDHKALVHITSAKGQCPRIQRRLECLFAYRYALTYRKDTTRSIVDFLSRSPQLATSADTGEDCHLCQPDDVRIYFVGAAGLRPDVARESSDDSSNFG